MKTKALRAMLLSGAVLWACGDDAVGPDNGDGPENRQPELASIPAVSVTGGEVETLTLTATDADGDPLTFTLADEPAFVSVTDVSQSGDTATATLRIAPGLTRVGAFDATIEVSDDKGGVDDGDLDITVEESSFNVMADATTEVDAAINEFVEDNEAFISLSFLGDYIIDAVHSSSSVSSAMRQMSGPKPGLLPGLTGRMPDILGDLRTLASAPAGIPTDALGTWEWDPEMNAYVKASETPADRARFTLYAVDPVTELPHLPLDEIGYVDFIDTSSPPTVALRVQAVVLGITLIDVEMTGDMGNTVDLEFQGFFSNADETARLDFDIDYYSTSSDLDLTSTFSFGDYTAYYGLYGTETGWTSALTVTDGVDRALLDLEISSDGTISSGFIDVNGTAVVVDIHGHIDGTITFTDADGNPHVGQRASICREFLNEVFEFSEVVSSVVGFAEALVLGPGDGEPDPEVMVTLALPGDAAGQVFGIFIDTDLGPENGYVSGLSGTADAGTELTYSLGAVEPGSYFAYAVVCVASGDCEPEPADGDWAGAYGTPITLDLSLVGGYIGEHVTGYFDMVPNVIVPSSGVASFEITLHEFVTEEEVALRVGDVSATEFIVSYDEALGTVDFLMPNAGAAGTHQVVATVYGSVFTDAAPWTQETAVDPTDPENDDPETAPPIEIPADGVGSFLEGDVVDWYVFELDAETTVESLLNWNNEKDLDLLIADEAMEVECAAATYDKPEHVVCTLPAGTHYVAVIDYDAYEYNDFALVSYRGTAWVAEGASSVSAFAPAIDPVKAAVIEHLRR